MKEKDFLNYFSQVDSIEFYSTLKNNRDFQKFESKTLLNWSKKALSNSVSILNSYPAENYSNQGQGQWLISSCNIKDLSLENF